MHCRGRGQEKLQGQLSRAASAWPLSRAAEKTCSLSGAPSESEAARQHVRHGKAGEGRARQEGLHPEVEEQHLQVPRVPPHGPHLVPFLFLFFFGPGPRPRVPFPPTLFFYASDGRREGQQGRSHARPEALPYSPSEMLQRHPGPAALEKHRVLRPAALHNPPCGIQQQGQWPSITHRVGYNSTECYFASPTGGPAREPSHGMGRSSPCR